MMYFQSTSACCSLLVSGMFALLLARAMRNALSRGPIAKILDRGSPSKDSVLSKTTQSRMTVPATVHDLLKLVKQHTHKLLTTVL